MSVDSRWDKEVQAAVETLARGRGDWVSMVDLRHVLDGRGTSRAAQDKHLKRMSRERKIHLAPESNRKALTDTHHAAAIRIGGDDCHIVCWNHRKDANR